MLSFFFLPSKIDDKFIGSLGYCSKLTSYNTTRYTQAKQEKYYQQQQTVQSIQTLYLQSNTIQYNTL